VPAPVAPAKPKEPEPPKVAPPVKPAPPKPLTDLPAAVLPKAVAQVEPPKGEAPTGSAGVSPALRIKEAGETPALPGKAKTIFPERVAPRLPVELPRARAPLAPHKGKAPTGSAAVPPAFRIQEAGETPALPGKAETPKIEPVADLPTVGLPKIEAPVEPIS